MSSGDVPKRVFDVVVGAAALVASLPVQLVVAAGVAATTGRPVLFAQERPGKGGRIFTLRKFRSMKPVDEERGLVDDDQRLTAFGRVIRSTSLDELPSLWNVVRGDMSLVGPRPLLVEYLPLYSPEQARRHEVRPGLTGLAQVSGRNDIGWETRLALDVRYVESRSFWLDLKILGMTVAKVVRRDGVSSPGHATMPVFRGSLARDHRGDAE